MIDRYSRPIMKALWTEEAKYKHWAAVERAHLQALVEDGQAPATVVDAFENAFEQKTAADYLKREEQTGHDVIAFVAEIGDAMGETGRFLHRGLTSSDVLDTGTALRMRASVDILLDSLSDVRLQLTKQTFLNSQTLCIGRTHGIHAEPMSFAHVLASHFAEFQRAHSDLLRAKDELAFGKLSGAVGHYSQLSLQFEARVLSKLDLKPETVATQVVPRDRHMRVANAVLSATTAVERFATNIRHLARTEVGEVLEPFSKTQKGSSAMPHKKNPILAENLCGLARTIRGFAHMLSENVALWHERDISHSSVERVALPDLFVTADFMLDRTARLVENMVVRTDVMLANVNRTGGLWCSQTVLTSLVEAGMNRTQAYELVQRIALPISENIAKCGVDPDAFLNALAAEKSVTSILGESNLKALFDAKRFLKSCPQVLKRCFGVEHVEAAESLSFADWRQKVPALQTVYHVEVSRLPDVLDAEAQTIDRDLKQTGVNANLTAIDKKFVVQTSGREHKLAISTYAQSVLTNSVMETTTVKEIQ